MEWPEKICTGELGTCMEVSFLQESRSGAQWKSFFQAPDQSSMLSGMNQFRKESVNFGRLCSGKSSSPETIRVTVPGRAQAAKISAEMTVRWIAIQVQFSSRMT